MIDLKRIVEMRERRVADRMRNERQAKSHMRAAEAMEQQAREAMRSYAEEVSNIEQEMLAEIVGKEVTLDDIRKIEETLREIEEKAQDLAQAYEQAKQATEKAEEAAVHMHRARVAAEAKFNKIREVDTVLQAEQRVLAQAAEDAELDSFAEIMAARAK